jgi:hypothetical protein
LKKLIVKVISGEIIKRNLLAELGKTVSLIKSLKPSAKGCNKPATPITSGPIRLCIPAIIVLSARVKYATDINKGRTIIKIFNKVKKIKIINILNQTGTASAKI